MKRTLLALAALSAALLCQAPAFAGEPAQAAAPQVTEPLKMLGLLTLLSLLPAIVLTMTSFTRVIIVLGFVRTGIGSQQTPPNQVLVGIALFVTMFVMAPVAKEVHDNAYKPYAAQQINEDEAIARATRPIRSFMLRHTREADLALFYEAAQQELPKTEEEVPLTIAVPAFVVSELTTAFQMGVLVLLPFLLVDLACASVLMSMGMMMVPPASISLPLKLLLFVVVDGWHLLVGSLLKSFV